MTTRLFTATVIALICLAPVSRAETDPLQCRKGTGDLGIGMYVCEGGSCVVSARLPDGGIAHRFSVEPRVTNIDPKGPSFGTLRENDVVVAIDGSLVTTAKGGYALANAKIGLPVTLRIRRGANEMAVTIVPAAGCNLPGLTVRN